MTYELPDKTHNLLKVSAAIAAARGEQLLHDVLAVAEFELKTNVDEDAIQVAHYGHTLQLAIPADLWVRVMQEGKSDVEDAACKLLNDSASVAREHFYSVELEPSDSPSSLELYGIRERDADLDLWEDTDVVRLFVSHIDEHNSEMHKLKEKCEEVGIACFVAHEDIPEGDEWEPNLRRALSSMDALLAWLTPGFSDSPWTDQEVGFAVARRVPIIPVKMGIDPYGFMGKYQAISVPKPGLKARTGLSFFEQPWHPAVASKIVTLLLACPPETSGRMINALVNRFEHARSFEHARKLIGCLREIQSMPADLIERVETASEENSQIRENNSVGTVKKLLEDWRG